jgi:hypothetical protein
MAMPRRLQEPAARRHLAGGVPRSTMLADSVESPGECISPATVRVVRSSERLTT